MSEKLRYAATILVMNPKRQEAWLTILVEGADWWEARESAVKKLKLTGDAIFSAELMVSLKK